MVAGFARLRFHFRHRKFSGDRFWLSICGLAVSVRGRRGRADIFTRIGRAYRAGNSKLLGRPSRLASMGISQKAQRTRSRHCGSIVFNGATGRALCLGKGSIAMGRDSCVCFVGSIARGSSWPCRVCCAPAQITGPIRKLGRAWPCRLCRLTVRHGLQRGVAGSTWRLSAFGKI